MKKIQALSSLCILIAAAAVPLAAQSITVTANIPFEFVVGDHTMPAGEYTVSNAVGTNALTIGARDGSALVFVGSALLRADEGYPDTSELLFRRYGNQYYLSEVWSSATPIGRELLKSRTERELTKTSAVKPETEIVLAQARSVRKTVAR